MAAFGAEPMFPREVLDLQNQYDNIYPSKIINAYLTYLLSNFIFTRPIFHPTSYSLDLSFIQLHIHSTYLSSNFIFTRPIFHPTSYSLDLSFIQLHIHSTYLSFKLIFTRPISHYWYYCYFIIIKNISLCRLINKLQMQSFIK